MASLIPFVQLSCRVSVCVQDGARLLPYRDILGAGRVKIKSTEFLISAKLWFSRED